MIANLKCLACGKAYNDPEKIFDCWDSRRKLGVSAIQLMLDGIRIADVLSHARFTEQARWMFLKVAEIAERCASVAV